MVEENLRSCDQEDESVEGITALPASPAQIAAAKGRQRHVFTFGVVASLIPIGCQILIGYFIWSDGKNDFPRADYSIVTLNFWVAQLLLLCIAVGSSTLVDFSKFVLDKSVGLPATMTKVLALLFMFVVASVYFSSTILGTDVVARSGWPLFIVVPALLVLSYVIDMDLVLIEADA